MIRRGLDPDLQDLFLLPAVDGQHPVAGGLCHRLREIVIGLVDSLLLRVLRLGSQKPPPLCHAAHIGTDHLRVREALRQNVAGALDGILRGQHALFLRKERLRFLLQRLLCLLGPDDVRQAGESLLCRHSGAGSALRTVRAVDVIHRDRSLRGFDLCSKLRGQFSLGLNGLPHLRFLFLQIPEGGQAGAKSAELLVIQRSRRFLSVSRDKGDGAAFVDQLYRRVDLPLAYFQLLRDLSDNVHTYFPFKTSLHF